MIPIRKTLQRVARTSLVVVVAFVAVQCRRDPEVVLRVAVTNDTRPVTATVAQFVRGITFSAADGRLALNVVSMRGKPATATFSATNANSITFVSGTTQFTANVAFGPPCVLTVTASTMPDVAVGSQITATACTYTILLAGVPADGRVHLVGHELDFGATGAALTSGPAYIRAPSGSLLPSFGLGAVGLGIVLNDACASQQKSPTDGMPFSPLRRGNGAGSGVFQSSDGCGYTATNQNGQQNGRTTTQPASGG